MSDQNEKMVEIRTTPWLKHNSAWFLLAFVIGLILRLVLLDGLVYAQNELRLVNQALEISRGVGTTSLVPAYTGLTAVLFFFFGANNFLARIIPALAGASMVLLPWVWKERFGTRTALVLSFAVALDPTFLLFSRAINGGMLALAGVFWTYTFLKRNQSVFAGGVLAFAFLSGQVIWSLLIILGLTRLFILTIRPDLLEEFRLMARSEKSVNLAEVFLGFVVTALLILTSFLLNPSGIGGLASSITGFVDNFVLPFEKSFYHTIYLQLAHGFLPLTLFFVGYLHLRNSKPGAWYRIGAVSIVITIMLCMVFSRDSFELTLWPVLVAWLGSAVWIGQLEIDKSESWLPKAGLLVFSITILFYLVLHLDNLLQQPTGSPQFWNVFLMLAAGVILILSAWWLVRFAWSKRSANQVFLLAFLIFLALVSLSRSFRSLNADQQFTSLEYLDDKLVMPNNEVDALLEEFALTGRSLPQAGGYSLVNLPDEYAWYFRDFDIERNDSEVSTILTGSASLPQQEEDYRGMKIVLTRTLDWRKNSGIPYMMVLAGKMPDCQDQKGVLWVRLNLFTGASQ